MIYGYIWLRNGSFDESYQSCHFSVMIQAVTFQDDPQVLSWSFHQGPIPKSGTPITELHCYLLSEGITQLSTVVNQ